VVASAIIIAGAISANAVQAAPVAIVAITAAALKGGAALTASTAALVNGTLKLIAWYKLKTAALVGIGTIAVAGTVLVVENAGITSEEVRQRLGQAMVQLDDGIRQTNNELHWVSWPEEGVKSAQQEVAAQAVRKLGTNALPFLVSSLEKQSAGIDGVFGWHGLQPAAFHRRALLAFDALGPVARPAIPDLTRILDGTNCPHYAALALASIGPEGWSVLAENVSNKQELSHAAAIWAIGSHRAAAPATINALVNFFNSHRSSGEDPMCGWAMARLGLDRDRVIGMLIEGLSFHRLDSVWGSALALGEIGPAASNAVPKLRKLAVESPNPMIRHDAAQALELIDPKVAAADGVTGALATRHIPLSRPD